MFCFLYLHKHTPPFFIRSLFSCYKTLLAFQQWIQQAPNEDLHLPSHNVFIPTDLSLKAVAEQVCYIGLPS